MLDKRISLDISFIGYIGHQKLSQLETFFKVFCFATIPRAISGHRDQASNSDGSPALPSDTFTKYDVK